MNNFEMQPNRTIVISEPITDELAQKLIYTIHAINEFDSNMSVVSTYEAMPIQMYINSGGGSATAGFAIIEAMESSETPIVTYGLGLVGSMALGIFVCGDYRYASKYTRFMYHSLSYGVMGHITDHDDMAIEANILQGIYDGFFLARSEFTQDKMSLIRKMKKDYFFSAEQAVEFGIADEVVIHPKRNIVKEKE